MARTHGLAVLLLGLGLSRIVLADEPAAAPPAPSAESSSAAAPAAASPSQPTPLVAAPPATAAQAQQTVERAIVYLQAESAAWMNTRKCAACHHAPMPLWALNEAASHGYAIDSKYVTDTFESTIGSPEKLITAGLFDNPNGPPDPRPQGQAVKVATAFMAVAARSQPSLSEGQKQTLGVIVEAILKKQREDGGWDFYLSRPPINESETTEAAWLVLALQGETDANAPEAQRAALAKAKAWLAATPLADKYQDRVLKLLLAIRAGEARDTMQTAIDELFALQRADGGWQQKADMPSDAFATGQTLYVLALAGYTADNPEVKRAIDFLVATQQPDGSWPMTSRSSPDGSTGGSSKLLTPIFCGAGSWATMGLSYLVPKGP
jgi:hypothetical protein